MIPQHLIRFDPQQDRSSCRRRECTRRELGGRDLTDLSAYGRWRVPTGGKIVGIAWGAWGQLESGINIVWGGGDEGERLPVGKNIGRRMGRHPVLVWNRLAVY